MSQSTNTQLVDSLLQVILSLPAAERALLEEKLFANLPYPSTVELAHLSYHTNAFDFLHDEPNLYTEDNGEPIEWH
jgi:hypothetical protein